MRWVKQLDKAGCGIASVAMFLGISYTKAKELVWDYSPRAHLIGTPTRTIVFVLLDAWITSRGRLIPLRGKHPSVLKENALIKAKWEGQKKTHWHWLVWDAKRKKLLDPSTKQNMKYDYISYMTVYN